jgi:hypothetical protein
MRLFLLSEDLRDSLVDHLARRLYLEVAHSMAQLQALPEAPAEPEAPRVPTLAAVPDAPNETEAAATAEARERLRAIPTQELLAIVQARAAVARAFGDSDGAAVMESAAAQLALAADGR